MKTSYLNAMNKLGKTCELTAAESPHPSPRSLSGHQSCLQTLHCKNKSVIVAFLLFPAQVCLLEVPECPQDSAEQGAPWPRQSSGLHSSTLQTVYTQQIDLLTVSENSNPKRYVSSNAGTRQDTVKTHFVPTNDFYCLPNGRNQSSWTSHYLQKTFF